MTDTHSATLFRRAPALPGGYAMILCSPGDRVEFFRLCCEAGCSTPTMVADRSTFPCRAILCLLFFFGIPSAASCSTLEDSAKELAGRIAASLPAGENVSCEIHNLSSLKLEEIARVEEAINSELQDRGLRASSSDAAIKVVVTLSENTKNLVWTAEIHRADITDVVLVAAERSSERPAISAAMAVTIRSEKFWEGPEHILDALEIVNGAGKSRLVLLLSDSVRIQDRQTGVAGTIKITPDQSASRDPAGSLKEVGPDMVGLFLPRQYCTVNLESRTSLGCSPTEQIPDSGIILGHPGLIELTSPGPSPPGKGAMSGMMSVCGNSDRFLATGAGDDTQTDSLQLFQTAPSGAVSVSAELNFPGPITALHAGIVGLGRSSAVVRNLATGNYEAYRLSFSCGQ